MNFRNDLTGMFRIFLSVILALVIAGVVLAFLFGTRYWTSGTGYGYGMMGFGSGGMWIFGGLFMIIPIILFFLFIYWMVGIASDHGHRHMHDDFSYHGSSAIDTLDERYAKGEINKEQYDAMKSDILKR